MATIQPNGARIVVKIDKETHTPTKTKSGLVIPYHRESSRPKVITGVVQSVGQGKLSKRGNRIPIDPAIQPGVRVATSYHFGDIIQVDGEELRILGEHQVLAIVEDWDGGAISDPHQLRR